MEVTSFNFLYMLEMLLPAIGLCIPLKKRKHGMGKAMAIIIVGTCLLGVLPIFYIKYYGTEMQQGILWVESVILMFVWFVLIWAILIFSIYFCTESSIYEAMYIFALSYGVEHIFYCIRVLVEHFTGGIIGNKHPLVYIPCLAGSFLLAYFWFAKGTVVEITGLKDASPVIERHRGFHEVMKNYPGIKVVTLESNWKMERAQELMKQYLDKGGHADGVFGHSDLGAIGAFLEAERRGIDKQMLIVGIDGLPGEWEGVDRVKRGQFAASYVYPTQGEKIMELAMNILQGKPYKKDNVMKSFLATPENCDAIALQYQDLEAKMKNLDQISVSLDSYTEVSRIQKWMLVVAFVLVLVLLFVIYYIYKVYRKKLQKQKAVARGFIENKEGWAAELNHLDESDRYFMDRFKKKILENMGNADMKMDDLGAQMLLSKVQLYRKVKAMTGKTPAELLKEMRLQRAYTLLMQTDKTVAEVSAEVGFALPGYFSSCFKKQYGVLPTDLRHKPV
jgi:AraC-like DNA-binding protein